MDKDYLLNMMKFLLPSEAEEDVREQSALRLASLGWSLPTQFSYKQINEAANSIYTQEQVDEAMLSFYTDNELSVLKDLLFNQVVVSPDFEPWKNVVKDCYKSFEQGFFLVVVPTLITVIEGYLSLKIGTLNSTNIRMRAPTKTKAEEPKEHRLDNTIWISIYTIIDNLYQKSDFTGTPPANLNRHWVLHGRNTPAEAKIDSVKLFNLLGSLSIA